MISIHALREEGDSEFHVSDLFHDIFLSTPSARRATRSIKGLIFGWMDFYPRPPRGGRRPCLDRGRDLHQNFYPRPPRGGRLDQAYRLTLLELFLSTPSARRATVRPEHEAAFLAISIHALREEGDVAWRVLDAQFWDFYPRPPRGGRRGATPVLTPHGYFYPRPPRGGRPKMELSRNQFNKFLSTPSARRATSPRIRARRGAGISIHALREEGDPQRATRYRVASYFYPRPPRGGRLLRCSLLPHLTDFYPRPPRGGRQQKQRQNLYFQTNCTTFCTNLEEP